MFRLSWKYCPTQTAERIQEERRQRQAWYVSERGGCRCFLQTRRLGPVYSSAARALIFIQASTCIQTVIHAGSRQRDATEKSQTSHLQASFTRRHTHEWVTCSCVSYLGTGTLVSQSPCENKDVSFNTAAGGKALIQAYMNCVYKDSNVLLGGLSLVWSSIHLLPLFPLTGH